MAPGNCGFFDCLTIFLNSTYHFSSLREFQIWPDRDVHFVSVLQVAPRQVRRDIQNNLWVRSSLLPPEQGTTLGMPAAFFKTAVKPGSGWPKTSKNTVVLSYFLKFALYFICLLLLLDCHKPLAVFWSSDKVSSDCFWLFFQCFCGRMEVWNCLLHFADITLKEFLCLYAYFISYWKRNLKFFH